jgi:hypothetical protein
MPDFSALARVARIDGVPLLRVLSLRDPKLIGLASALCALAVPLGLFHLPRRLRRAARAILCIIAGRSVSVSHKLLACTLEQGR